jgi:hypothetical protein
VCYHTNPHFIKNGGKIPARILDKILHYFSDLT